MLKLVILSLFSGLLLADGPVVKTGQNSEYIWGDDGTYMAGEPRSYSRDAIGVVTDKTTKLQWEDTPLSASAYKSWSAAQSYCAQLNLNGTGWRLPTKRELETLVDYGKSGLAIDSIFENMAFTYWSATPYVNDDTQAATVTYSGGYSQSKRSKTDTSVYVRCVRNSSSN